MIEFTGERVVPGQVDPDLWNEHLARYAFAARIARRKRVLDAGCGTGYGSFEISRNAERVVGLDISAEAVGYAAAHFRRANLSYLQASASAIPLANDSFDLVIAYELVEHMDAWEQVLEQCRRVLAPGGQVVVSTPNKLYYAESRKLTGPNPYHVHEFDFAEFREALKQFFPHVCLYTQNHAHSIVFRAVEDDAVPDEGAVRACHRHLGGIHGASKRKQRTSICAVCALCRQTGAPTFVHIPKTSNVLREREQHIELLEKELATKDQWLAEAKPTTRISSLLFQKQQEELEERRRWADDLNRDLEESRATIERLNGELEERANWASQLNTQVVEAGRRIVELQSELAAEQEKARQAIDRLERENRDLDTAARPEPQRPQ